MTSFHKNVALAIRDEIVRKVLESGFAKEGETFESMISCLPWGDEEDEELPTIPEVDTPVIHTPVMCEVGCQTDPMEVIKDVPKVQNPRVNRKVKIEMRHQGNTEVIGQNCMCRMWNPKRYDNIQCDRVQVDGEEYCKQHLKKVEKYGSWWCGRIDEPRNEEQKGPPDTKVSNQRHYWHDQVKVKSKSPEKVKNKSPEKKDDLTYTELPNGMMFVS